MNKPADDWEKELRQGPFRRRTFTEAKMNAIERQIAAGTGRSAARARIAAWTVSLASIVLLVIAVSAVLVNVRGDDPVQAKPPQPTPTSVPTAAPDDSGSYVKLKADWGLLRKVLPFDTEKVRSITVERTGQLQVITIPEDRVFLILKDLYYTNLDKALAYEQPSGKNGAVLRLHTPDRSYAIPYDLDTNTYKFNDKLYYADDKVAFLMYFLLKPESDLAKVERLTAQADREMEQSRAIVDESFSYDIKRFEINDLDYNGWSRKAYLNKAFPTINYYSYNVVDNSVANFVVDLRYNERNAIVYSLNSIFFLNDYTSTSDHIKVGLTKKQVLEKLGKPNLQLNSKWSYKIDDYLRFHIYYENDRVAGISLTMPV
ncbi:hypothetical protein ACFPVX_14915 [Cohnella faecalis]|uniref:Uncharacterized protein n=1 Tax=Cohnella faecalis TaxID=2315694 RepID=A0A398CKQ9_9BACL|nr:hypothetical protein [Cohnella faecalis]RIE01789.1 hypothetical protein D3H35_13385 [Cohnella faecalis]